MKSSGDKRFFSEKDMNKETNAQIYLADEIQGKCNKPKQTTQDSCHNTLHQY
jgi:hypothetical protein